MKIILISEAKKKNLKYYFTNKPCKHGHISKRNTNTGLCLDCMKAHNNSNKMKKYRDDNYHKRKAYDKERYEKHKNEVKEKSRLYRKNNKEKCSKYHKENRHKKNYRDRLRNNTKEGKMILSLRYGLTRIIRHIKESKKIRTLENINFTINELVIHIEKQFKEGMTWDNHGEWHIDHIKPVSKLVAIHKGKSQEELHNIVNALDNLQPLWADENLRKSDKWE